MKKLISLIILFLIIPFVTSANYGEGKYGCGAYGIGCEEVEEVEEAAGSLGRPTGARGGGCDVFADEYKVCYHIDPVNLTCEIGCLEGYYCDENYRCQLGKLVIKTVTETILERTGGKKAVIVSLFLLFAILLGFISEVKKQKNKQKSTERIIKEASSEVYKKEE